MRPPVAGRALPEGANDKAQTIAIPLLRPATSDALFEAKGNTATGSYDKHKGAIRQGPIRRANSGPPLVLNAPLAFTGRSAESYTNDSYYDSWQCASGGINQGVLVRRSGGDHEEV